MTKYKDIASDIRDKIIAGDLVLWNEDTFTEAVGDTIQRK